MTFVFEGVSVAQMDSERVVDSQTVVVEGERIVWIGPEDGARVPSGAVRIDGRGKHLMPGLTDMHCGRWLPAADLAGLLDDLAARRRGSAALRVPAASSAPDGEQLRFSVVWDGFDLGENRSSPNPGSRTAGASCRQPASSRAWVCTSSDCGTATAAPARELDHHLTPRLRHQQRARATRARLGHELLGEELVCT